MAKPLPKDSVYVGKPDQQGMLTDQHAQKNRIKGEWWGLEIMCCEEGSKNLEL